ncbi:MAG: PLP-dependent aminotransferase family protein [Anaerolineae bacterium]|jgi:2-aminoadipate transaminase|nr:PLP-dependent aminotransferase family protein [Anaerolineae bacterium]MBL8107345.1 PLP-dependent aminotransferase family protein [Anaerolineales bacterium]MCC7189490.1 PLP-dependent aminotransferase family protein [Anaerolineales bacterium]
MNPFSIIQTSIPPDVIDLGLGNPPLSLLPLDMIRESAQQALAHSDSSILQYGTEQGNGHFRAALAEFLGGGYGFSVNADNLFVTTGISNALDLVCTFFTKPGDTILVEEPSYFLALRIFADHGLNVIPVETDENGLVPASLAGTLASAAPKFLYLIPTFQNPTGYTLPQGRREEIVRLAEKHNFLIVADEVYQLLNYSQQPPKPFGAFVDSRHVISLGSFSKILAPGLRLGWMQAHADIIHRFANSGLMDSGGGLNPFTSAILRGMIESGGLGNNIARLKQIYLSQIQVMDEALRRHIPQAKYEVPHGGYFFWLKFPEGIDVGALRKGAGAFNVDFRQGALFSSSGGLKNYMRLCFVMYEADKIEEGVKRIAECVNTK